MNEILQLTENSKQILTITELALSKIKELSELEKAEALRVGIKGGGCSGWMYTLDFISLDSVDKEEDKVIRSDIIPIIIDYMSEMYLTGTTLDYVIGLQESGFKFINPNAKRSCGCGSSFST